MTNPEAMQDALAGGLFDPEPSAAQKAALEKLEVTLALVEGWVDEVVSQATAERMPAAAKLQETVRRRRAAGGPAEQTFATLVGLELRPRRLRDASVLWGSLRTRQGTEARDGVWMSPHLLPTAADLDDPLGFREDSVTPGELSEEEFDAGLRDLLDGGDGTAPAPPSDPPRERRRHAVGLGRADARAGRTPRPLPRPPGRAPRRPGQGVLPRPPHRRRDRRLPRRRRGAPQPPPQGRRVAGLRRPPRARRRLAGRRRPARAGRGVRADVVRLRRGAAVARRARGGVLLRPRHRPPPRRALPGHRRAGRRPRHERGVARRALVAGRRVAGDVRRHVRPHRGRGRAGAAAQSSAQSSSTPGGGSSRAAAE